MGINNVNISGNVTRDAELNQPRTCAKFSVAVSTWSKDGDKTAFVDCKILGKRADSLSSYIGKGAKVAISGRLDQSTWQDKSTGKNRSKLEVIVNEIEFLGSETRKSQPAQTESRSQRNAKVAGSESQDSLDGRFGVFDEQSPYSTEEIPF